MKETQRISKLFKDLFEGSPWIDVNIIDSLKNISAENAAKRVLPNQNTIWEIVNHLIAWRLNVLQRVQGKVIKTPANNYFEPVKNVSPIAWNNTLRRLKESQDKWLKYLDKLKAAEMTKVYLCNKMTYYEHIQGIIQHDAYHLGQISLLRKYF